MIGVIISSVAVLTHIMYCAQKTMEKTSVAYLLTHIISFYSWMH